MLLGNYTHHVVVGEADCSGGKAEQTALAAVCLWRGCIVIDEAVNDGVDACGLVANSKSLDELFHLESSSLALFVQFVANGALYCQRQGIIGAVGHG